MLVRSIVAPSRACAFSSIAGAACSLALLLSTLLWWPAADLLCRADEPQVNQPHIAAASDEAAEALQRLRLPENWQARLFAAEPMTANIVAFDIDHRGRVFVAESYRQNKGVTDNRGHDQEWLMADLSAKTVQDRIDYHKRLLPDGGKSYTTEIDRVRRLLDTDQDGVADQATTYAEGFNRLEEGTAAGVLARGQNLYLTCIPKLWNLIDADDDGKVDESIVMSDGYGVRVAFRGHDLHGLVIGPDKRLYYSIGDRGYHVTTPEGKRLSQPAAGAVFRCELDGTQLEVFASGMRNPQELAFNDVGDLFSGDNNSDSGDRARLIHILQGGDSGWRMYYQYLPDRGPFNRERIWEPFHNEQPAHIVPPIANFADGPSGLAYYPGTGFGDRLKDTFLLADFRGTPANSGVRAFQLQPDGAFYKLAGDEELIWSFLATDVMFGPDGAIWVSDWVDGWNGEGKGRIYRVTDPTSAEREIVAEVQQLLSSDWQATETAELKRLLSHADRRIRLEAQWQLADRGELETLLAVAADTAQGYRTRLHAIWGSDQICRCDPPPQSPSQKLALDAIATLLSDEEPFIQAAAAKFVSEHIVSGEAPVAVLARLREMLKSNHPRVQYFATIALGKLGDQAAWDALLAMLEANDNRDPALRHAGVMALVGLNQPEKLAALTTHPSVSVRRVAVVALRRLQHPRAALFLSDTSPLVVLEAARAIHDVPIGVGMEALAKLIEHPSEDDALMRRVLNANYRTGSPAAAERLARFAETVSGSEAMRLEALSMLENWAQPDPRDRVLNDVRPLAERPIVDARVALKAVMPGLMKSPEAIKTQAVSLAASLGLDDVVPILVQRIAAKDLQPRARAAALESLVKLDAAQAVQVAQQALSSNQTALRIAALKVLTERQPATAVVALRSATQSSSMEERQQAWDLLARLNDPNAQAAIAQGIQDYVTGKVPADTQLNLLEAAAGKLTAELQTQLDEALAQRDAASPAGKWLSSLEGGNAEAGKALFVGKTELSCVRCHKVAGQGGEVGPDLSGIGTKRDRQYLLESIVTPDSAIAEGFETAVLADDLGVIHTGIVLNETDEELELINADGTKIKLAKDEIVARSKGKSAMPADLIKYLSARQLRDLVAYLASLKQ